MGVFSCCGSSHAASEPVPAAAVAQGGGGGGLGMGEAAAQKTPDAAMPVLLGRRAEEGRQADEGRPAVVKPSGSRVALPKSESLTSDIKIKGVDGSPACSSASTPTGYTGPIAKSVNTVIEHVWPRISKYTTEVIMNVVQPQLLEQLPSALQSLNFDPERCHLGQKPLEFRRVQIVRDEQETSKGSMNNLVFQARIDWEGDLSVYLRYAGAGLGIKGLTVRGVLVFEFVGLTDEPPFIQGYRAFFNNKPEIDIQFQGTGEGLLNLNLIKHKIIECVDQGISDQLVLPNRLGCGLVPDADIFSIKCPPPQGILTLTVHSAKDLLGKDISWFGRATSDPYVVVQCGAYRFKSETRSRTTAPVFEFKATVPVTEVAHQRINFELFDADMITHDDFLGRVSLPVQNIIDWGWDKLTTLELEDEEKQRGKSGSVTISARWESLAIDATGEHFDEPGMIFAGVESASNLTRAGEGTQYWVKVSCSGTRAGFPKASEETERKAEDVPEESKEVTEHHGAAESWKKRIAILRKTDLSEDEMAAVLGVSQEALRACLLMRSETQAAGTLAAQALAAAFTAKFEHGFEFPVEKIGASVVTFTLMRKKPGACHFAEELGTYEAPTSALRGATNCTQWRTVYVPGTDARLRIKLGMRYLAPLDARAGQFSSL